MGYIQSAPAILDDQDLVVFRPLQRGSGIEINPRVIEISDGNAGVLDLVILYTEQDSVNTSTT